MEKQFFKLTKYALLFGLAVLSAEIFWPRHYNMPSLPKRASTQYWDLSTGSRIAYTLLPGKGQKKLTPIIYLHGGPGGPISDAHIERLLPLTADGYDVYLYDQIGGGFSARLENIEAYTADRHKQDLEAIVQKIGTEQVILIAQSWGGLLANLFAAENPNKLAKIIFTCPGPIYPVRQELKNELPPDTLQLREPYFSNAQGNAKTNSLRARAMTYLATAFGIKLASDAEADDFSTFRGREVNKSVVCDTTKFPVVTGGSGFYVSACTMASLSTLQDPRPKLRAVKCPVLVMKGQCDNQKWGFTKEYLDVFPNSQLIVIPNAGHSIGFEQPELYTNTIRAFLRNSE